MYENMEGYALGKDIIKIVKNLITEGIYVEEIQPFCINTVNQFTENDIIVNMAGMFSVGITFLKPISIYFSNDSYVLGHKLIGTMYSTNGHFFSDNGFEGFTCLTIRGNFYGDILEPKEYTDSFILKCRTNEHCNAIIIDTGWLDFCRNKGVVL